jgi:hypothetical protein
MPSPAALARFNGDDLPKFKLHDRVLVQVNGSSQFCSDTIIISSLHGLTRGT